MTGRKRKRSQSIRGGLKYTSTNISQDVRLIRPRAQISVELGIKILHVLSVLCIRFDLV